MGRKLSDDITDDFTNRILNTEHFADTVAYTPKGGSVRTITVQICGMHGGVRHESHQLTNERMVIVWCRRHATLGVNDPQIGDKIAWEGETYNFDAVTGESSGEFHLRFKCVERSRVGNMPAFRN
jgi:hypothetical protein